MRKNSNFVISVSGKGGVGKTAFTVLTLKTLIKYGESNILVIDADPATNLPDVLGVSIDGTVGEIVDDLKEKLSSDNVFYGQDKKALLEGLIYRILYEGDNFDLLAMGRGEGEGCYCLVNNLLTQIIDALSANYDYVLLDMEAGLEHVSRRTARDVDIMIIVTDSSKMGIQTVSRIQEIAKEVHISFREMYVVANKVSDSAAKVIKTEIEKLGIPFAGYIPYDENIATYNLAGKPLLDLPDNSPSLQAVERILKNMKLKFN